ncbi:beta-galactosidase small subunit [Ruthenibacterium lactatiformans]|uniref:beta-galactosidase small subunit n=1 Tax=Ruthenibacterium lactatiformans TaxID=1550024 RepID=UPI0039A2B456
MQPAGCSRRDGARGAALCRSAGAGRVYRGCVAVPAGECPLGREGPLCGLRAVAYFPEGAGKALYAAGHAGGGRLQYRVHGRDFSLLFTKNAQGSVILYRWKGRELLQRPIALNFWRAPTDNDTAAGMELAHLPFKTAGLYAKLRRAKAETDGTSVRIHAKYALPGGARANVTYTITGDGKVEAALKWKGKAVESVPEFGLMLTLPAEYRNVAYYGMGPGETYSDFTSGAHMGLFGFDAHTALQPYFNPQESGARTGVQAAAVTDAAGFGLCLAGNGFMLSALPYTPHEVENARRQYELPPKVKTVVRCAKGQLGVAGDNTWGAGPHAEYHVALEKGETFRFTFGGMGGNG